MQPIKAQIIEMTFTKEGEVKIETTGFSGKACQSASLPYEQALGVKQSETMTAEGLQHVPPIKNVIKAKI